MSCLSLSGPPLGPPVPVLTPSYSIGLPFYTAMLLINQSINHLLLHKKDLQGLKINTLYITNNTIIRCGEARFGMELLVVGALLATCTLSNKNEATVIKTKLGWVLQKWSKSSPKVVQK